ncbi:hypothetical protein ABBQ38_002265 [Trebouxia sp. C0009 RCD-2024]
MSPHRPSALAPPDGRGSQQHSMVPQTPASTGRRWTIFGSHDFDPAEVPDAPAAPASNTHEYYSMNPSFGLASSQRAPSPWPDVIMSSQHDLTPASGSLPAADFCVELPHSPLQHVTNDPFSHTASNASAAVGNAKLSMAGAADMYGEQKSKAVKAAVQENCRRTPNSRSCPNNTTRMGKLWHAASLSFAANPVRSHREWAGVIDRVNLPEPEVPQSAAPGVGALVRCLHRDFHPSNGHGRFVRLVSLEEAYASNKKRRRLAYALRRKQTGSGYKGLCDRIGNDLFIIGEIAFDRCTPRKLHGHAPWWTLIAFATCLVTFAYMAAQWPAYLASFPGSSPCSQQTWPQGPNSLWLWLCQWNDCRRFNNDYLILWGSRFGPKMVHGQNAYRWFSSLLLHKDFVQLGSNLLLFLALGVHLERRYGTRRIAILTVIAGVGGNFFSAAFEDLCSVVSSGSGATFGMLILFIVDVAFNFEAIRYPIVRILAAALLLGVFIAAATVRGLPARLSVLGGALTALFPALSMLPHLKSEKYEWWIPYMSMLTTIGFLLALPLYVYLKQLPGIAC